MKLLQMASPVGQGNRLNKSGVLANVYMRSEVRLECMNASGLILKVS